MVAIIMKYLGVVAFCLGVVLVIILGLALSADMEPDIWIIPAIMIALIGGFFFFLGGAVLNLQIDIACSSELSALSQNDMAKAIKKKYTVGVDPGVGKDYTVVRSIKEA